MKNVDGLPPSFVIHFTFSLISDVWKLPNIVACHSAITQKFIKGCVIYFGFVYSRIGCHNGIIAEVEWLNFVIKNIPEIFPCLGAH